MKRLCFFIILFSFSAFSGDLPKNSIYNLKSVWKDQNNSSVQLKDFAGTKVIIGMVYTKCPHACPLTISKIKDIEKQVDGLTKEKYKIVLASFDSKRDTPEQLKKFIKSRSLDESRWIFLSPENETIARELAVVLGVNFKELEDGEFSHSNVITALDEKGVRLSKIESLSAEIKPIVESFKIGVD
jgi:protein SCO1/2